MDVAWHKQGDGAPQREGQPKDARTPVARGKPAAGELHNRVPAEKGRHHLAFENFVQLLLFGELRESDRESHALKVANQRGQENASGDDKNVPQSAYLSVDVATAAAAAAADVAAVYMFHGGDGAPHREINEQSPAEERG